jgi:hypothetical protein
VRVHVGGQLAGAAAEVDDVEALCGFDEREQVVERAGALGPELLVQRGLPGHGRRAWVRRVVGGKR